MGVDRVNWSLADLIDLEILLAEDERLVEDSGREGLEERDRRLATRILGRAGTETPEPRAEDRRRWFHEWLRLRREQRWHGAEFTPGSAIAFGWALCGWLLGVAGFICGKAVWWVGISGTALRGSSADAPVNVWFFLLTCVAPQTAFALVATGLMLMSGRWWRPDWPPLIRGLFAWVARPLLSRVARKLGGVTNRKELHGLQGLMGLARGRSGARAEAFKWPLIGTIHGFALGYALAVVTGTLLSVQVWHQTFAWQTTVSAYTPERVHRLAAVLALPWSWAAGEGTGFPSLESVQQTRLGRHQHPATIPETASAQWWLFVLFCTVAYGVAPRAGLLVWSRWRGRTALAREQFRGLRFDGLDERLMRGRVRWEAPPDKAPEAGVASRRLQEGEHPMRAGSRSQPAECVVLIPQERSGGGLELAVTQWLHQRRRWETRALSIVEATVAGRVTAAGWVRAQELARSGRALVWVQEAFMPPTRELLGFLRDLRAAAGSGVALWVGLIGKPGADTELGDPVEPIDARVWRHEVRSLADADTEAEAFVESGGGG
jgi:hypothetical protein